MIIKSQPPLYNIGGCDFIITQVFWDTCAPGDQAPTCHKLFWHADALYTWGIYKYIHKQEHIMPKYSPQSRAFEHIVEISQSISIQFRAI